MCGLFKWFHTNMGVILLIFVPTWIALIAYFVFDWMETLPAVGISSVIVIAVAWLFAALCSAINSSCERMEELDAEEQAMEQEMYAEDYEDEYDDFE